MQILRRMQKMCIRDSARRVAAALEIPYYVMNFKKEFKEKVIDYFVQEYLHGRTPNPCIACNRYVKWESLLKRSMDIGADYIATGHYARVVQLENGRYTLKCSATLAKDQTYACLLYTSRRLAAKRKYHFRDATREEQQKQMAYFMRKGFSYENIRRALEAEEVYW